MFRLNFIIPSTMAFKCPACGNDERRKISEGEDKTAKPLYFSMQGSPVYPKQLICGNCGHKWKKS